MRTWIQSGPVVSLDRLGICADAYDRKAFLHQPGHRVLRSHFLRSSSSAYGRVLETQDTNTGATTLIYDQRRVPWIPKIKLILRAGEQRGLSPSDVLGATELLGKSRVSLLELAFDFPKQAGINTAFVMLHLLFGKSRWAARKPGIVWFGTRRSSKFVRCYLRVRTQVFRIELELHAAWLRRNEIQDCFDFQRIPGLIARRHIFFCKLDWDAVIRRIRRTVPNAPLALRNLSWEKHDLHATLRFLRGELRFTNTHRFLEPLALNGVVTHALNLWATQWPKSPFRLQHPRGTCL
ncbi:MAG TPA: hypothetical protein VKR82_14195 [Candidatus Acidoferrales bacterium]|nr:hypothetical protein [Candidatus Acidoferrales bacterium]